MTSLTFKTVDDISLAGRACAVTATGITNIPTFYVNKRSCVDGVWTIEALDRAAFVDRNVNMTGCTKYRNNTMYAVTDFVSKIQSDCGFSAVTIPYSPYTDPTLIACEEVDGKTYQTVLTSIAQAYGGFFYVNSSGALVFSLFYDVTSYMAAAAYSRIKRNGTYKYGSVTASDGQTTNTYGNSLPEYKVNNNFVDFRNGVCVSAYNALVTETFTGVQIDNVVIGGLSLPYPNSTIVFGNDTYRIASIEARVVGDTLIMSMSSSLPSEGEISRRGRLQKELDEKVSTEKTYGTLMTAYQGAIAVPNGGSV